MSIWARLVLAALCLPGPPAFAQTVDRYPFWIPSWLWDNNEHSHLINATDVLAIRADAAKYAEMSAAGSSPASDSLAASIARRLGSRFTIRDFYPGARRIVEEQSRTSVALQLDPAFDPTAQATLEQAFRRFLQVASDTSVIRAALARSTSTPRPLPSVYKTAEGVAVTDELGRPVVTSAHSLYLRSRILPSSPGALADQLRTALSTSRGEPALIVISSFCCRVWWGAGYYNFFAAPVQQLAREAPGQGYLYIELNREKLAPPEVGWNDPDFWAAKIAHEVLHNLGYWHPAYPDPAARDRANTGQEWAFLVSYESAIYDKLKRR